MAAPTSVAELASAVSIADVTGAVLAIAGILMTLYVAIKGAKIVIAFFRGR